MGMATGAEQIKFVLSSALVSSIDIQRMYGDSIPRRGTRCTCVRRDGKKSFVSGGLFARPLMVANKVWESLARQLKEELNDVEECEIDEVSNDERRRRRGDGRLFELPVLLKTLMITIVPAPGNNNNDIVLVV